MTRSNLEMCFIQRVIGCGGNLGVWICDQKSYDPEPSETRIKDMKTVTLTFSELALLVGTRAMLGAGIALLIAKRLSEPQRETAGIVLAGVGLLTTVPQGRVGKSPE